MLQEGNGILLLLSWSVNIRKEDGDVMATNQRHHPGVIEMIHVRFLFMFVGGFVGFFTVIHCFIGDHWFIFFGTSLSHSINSVTYCIHKVFREYVLRFIEMGRVPSGDAMAVMEISIHGNM